MTTDDGNYLTSDRALTSPDNVKKMKSNVMVRKMNY